jgi:UDP-N-acetylmuramoyl-tripeptide--D-alanyl-D-alanine ligase
MNVDAAFIAAATGGRALRDAGAGPVSTDTRAIVPGSWFLAIVGDRFDGHDFLAAAAEAGAAGCVVQRDPGPSWSGGVVLVDDTTPALQDLGRAARATLRGPVVGLSGSSGKTTTRTFIALALAPLGVVHQTVGNLNNHLGVPMTLLAAPPDAAACVVEMGTSSPGEIAFLADLATPDVRLLVNVGPAHLEELGGLEGVAREKGSLFDASRPGDIVVVNLDDPFLRAHPVPAGVRRVTWGEGGDVELLSADLDPDTLHTLAVFRTPDGEVSVQLPTPGRHIAHNAAGALAVAFALGVPCAEAAANLARYEPVGMRLRAEALPGGVLALNDAYNANPASMEASLRLLAGLPGRRVAVLGDMLELGPDEASWHQQVVGLARELALDLVVLVGPRMAAASAACPGSLAFEVAESAVAALRERLVSGDRVLFKGSRGARVERVIAGLRES